MTKTLFVGLLLAALAGYLLGRGTQEAQHAQQMAQAQQAAAKALQQAQAVNDALSTRLAQTLTQTATLQQEKTHALRLAAAGRVCLDGRTLSVLNTAPGLSVAGYGVPTPQPAAVAAGASAEPDTHPAPAPTGAGDLIATDADIGAWAIGAGAAFETCRARLNALIDWHQQEPPHAR